MSEAKAKAKTVRAWGLLSPDGHLQLRSIGDNSGSPQSYVEDHMGVNWEDAIEEGYREVELTITYAKPEVNND